MHYADNGTYADNNAFVSETAFVSGTAFVSETAFVNDSAIDLEAVTAPPPEVYPIVGPHTQTEGLAANTERDSAPAFSEADDAAPSTTKRRHSDPVFAVALPAGDARRGRRASRHRQRQPNGQDATNDVRPTSSPPAAERANALRTAAREMARQSKQEDAKPHRRLGPYTAADAERDLMGADDRDDVLNAFFDFAAQYFEYCALFVMHGDLAEGRDARGPGASPEVVRALGIPLDLPSAVATVFEQGKWQLVRLTGGGIDVGLAKDLKRESGPQCLLLPVIMRKRCVLVLYGDHGENDVRLSDVGDVISFAPLVASGLERVILKRKRAMQNDVLIGGGVSLPTRPPRRSHAPLPPVEARAKAFQGVLDSATSAPAPPPAFDASPAEHQSPSQAADEALKASAVPTRLSALPPPPLSQPPAAAAAPAPHTHRHDEHAHWGPARSMTQSGLGPSMGERPLTLDFNPTPQARHVAEEAPGSAWDLEGGRASVVPQRVVSIEPPARKSEPGSASHDSNELSRTQMSPRSDRLAAPAASTSTSTSEPPEEGWDVESRRAENAAGAEHAASSPVAPDIALGEAEFDREILDAIARDERAPLAAASRSISYSARPPSRRQSSEELRLPSVIVDFESDSRALVHRLCEGDPEAADKLIEMGASAVSALVAEFPGPITQPLSRGSAESLQRASDCGPLMKVLARIGAPAIPFLVVRTADTQPLVRGWATRLLGELPNRESGVAIARRLVDDNQDVRRAALVAARMHQRDSVARAAIREHIADVARDGSRSNEARHAALEALSDIRDAEAVPVLIRLLDDSNRELVEIRTLGPHGPHSH